jgi:LPS export ABC transporter protein LptC
MKMKKEKQTISIPGFLRRGGIFASFIVVLLLGFASCENDLEVVQSFDDPVKVPDLTTENVETLYFDSARLTARVTAPLMMKFTQTKDPYMEFPQGIHVQLYDSLKNVKAEVLSKYAIYNERQKIWEARKDVVVISTDGKKLNTEQLFWDQNKKIIYSDKFCRVTTPNASLTGNKFKADEDFKNYELTQVQGPLKVQGDE